VTERHDSKGYASDILRLVEGLRRTPEALPSSILAPRGGGGAGSPATNGTHGAPLVNEKDPRGRKAIVEPAVADD